MVTLMLVLFIIVILACFIIGYYAICYNKIQDSIIRINESEASIDNLLRNKFDMLNRSISIIRANTEIEGDFFKELLKLRVKKISNFEMDRVLIETNNEFLTIKDNNKNLNKSEEIKKISKEIITIDEKLEMLKDYYDSNITKYNKMIKIFPTNIIALLNKYEEKLFFDKKDMSDDDYEDFKL